MYVSLTVQKWEHGDTFSCLIVSSRCTLQYHKLIHKSESRFNKKKHSCARDVLNLYVNFPTLYWSCKNIKKFKSN